MTTRLAAFCLGFSAALLGVAAAALGMARRRPW